MQSPRGGKETHAKYKQIDTANFAIDQKVGILKHFLVTKIKGYVLWKEGERLLQNLLFVESISISLIFSHVIFVLKNY